MGAFEASQMGFPGIKQTRSMNTNQFHVAALKYRTVIRRRPWFEVLFSSVQPHLRAALGKGKTQAFPATLPGVEVTYDDADMIELQRGW